ncbi:MAG: hypothetical protein E5Y01_03170 [Mesorhizobium sp.]|uniref:hypothetical protein n=1 Tax=Mesorhizobium sp. TaxID=1871066 RepID=UPI001200B576|nr:hypothetical protein [Mesorhizobium sp.]TJV53329.1 MAG: hypothetical protein E5Y01_03170 [Mesorhizobium sp.]
MAAALQRRYGCSRYLGSQGRVKVGKSSAAVSRGSDAPLPLLVLVKDEGIEAHVFGEFEIKARVSARRRWAPNCDNFQGEISGWTMGV